MYITRPVSILCFFLASSLGLSSTQANAASLLQTEPSTEETASPASKGSSVEPFFAADRMVEFIVHDTPSRLWIEDWAVERTRELLNEMGVTPPGEKMNPWHIVVEVEGFSLGFTVKVSATRGGAPVNTSLVAKECMCNSEDLFTLIESELRRVVADLREISKPPVPSPGLLTAAQEPPISALNDPQPPQDLPPTVRGRKVGAMTIIGVILMPLSVAPLAIGAAGVARGTELMSGEQGMVFEEYNTPGRQALLGVGVAGFVAGFTMLLVDQTYCRRKHDGCKRVSASASGGLGPVLRF